MAKSLIITEKPSVAQEFARILGVSGRNDGYIENSDYVITWCVGHLVEMVYPEVYDEKYKKWKLEDLPFLPKEYKYDVIPAVSKQYDVVHKMLHREDIDTVYWAGDAGKEGQTIEENIRMFGGVREGMKELRVWIDSQTEEEIRRGIREAKPMSDYANLGKSGLMGTGTGKLEIPQAADVKDLLGNIDKNTGKIAKTVDLSDEQIKMLVDVAERKYVNNVNLTSQTPMITVQGQNTGNTEKDARNLADTLRDVLVDLMNAGSTVTVQ